MTHETERDFVRIHGHWFWHDDAARDEVTSAIVIELDATAVDIVLTSPRVTEPGLLRLLTSEDAAVVAFVGQLVEEQRTLAHEARAWFAQQRIAAPQENQS